MLEKTISNKNGLDVLMARVKKAQAEYAQFSQEQRQRQADLGRRVFLQAMNARHADFALIGPGAGIGQRTPGKHRAWFPDD